MLEQHKIFSLYLVQLVMVTLDSDIVLKGSRRKVLPEPKAQGATKALALMKWDTP